ncbi:uncharacterized protein PV09_05653 [Verruconis gallopava]|uniref:Uncharacterized protein n=1 Tax=Verruconis gallopava TaxID=253628 RepID=A0A0D2AV33_9PEZI|nr:uncharacterized protein PV09_05653 [Verruconis gallopava]KIW02994.1 hypothetical protein PV09_05653 [Verruconis gallopava]
MCTQDTFVYNCGHSVEGPDIDRCRKATQNNLPRCSDLIEQELQFPDPCPDCDADRRFNAEVETALQQSTREYGRERRSTGVLRGKDEEEDLCKRIGDMTFEEMRKRRELEEAELMEKVLYRSRVEFEQARDTSGARWRRCTFPVRDDSSPAREAPSSAGRTVLPPSRTQGQVGGDSWSTSSRRWPHQTSQGAPRAEEELETSARIPALGPRIIAAASFTAPSKGSEEDEYGEGEPVDKKDEDEEDDGDKGREERKKGEDGARPANIEALRARRLAAFNTI